MTFPAAPLAKDYYFFFKKSSYLNIWGPGVEELFCSLVWFSDHYHPSVWKNKQANRHTTQLLWGSCLATSYYFSLFYCYWTPSHFSFAIDWLLTQSLTLCAKDCHSHWQHYFSGFSAAWSSKLERSLLPMHLNYSLLMPQMICHYQQYIISEIFVLDFHYLLSFQLTSTIL